MRGAVKYCIFAFVTLLILFNPQGTIYYAKQGLELCANVLAPTLFPFFVCSGLLIYSGFCQKLAKAFECVMKPFFNISGNGAAAFVLGIISGYPLGAQTAIKLYENGGVNKTECERLLAFCNNSGPLFILGSVGVAVYHSAKIGAMLYGAHIAAAFTVGILFRFYKRGDSSNAVSSYINEDKTIGEIFQKALQGSISSILTVCAAVAFFSVAANLVAELIPNGLWRTLFVATGELTSGIRGISQMNVAVGTKLVLSSMAAGFAGFCVHLQVMSVAAGKGISLAPYITGKLLHALLSGIYTWLMLKISPVTVAVFARNNTVSGAFFAASVFTVMCTIILSVVAVLTIIISNRKRKNPLS